MIVVALGVGFGLSWYALGDHWVGTLRVGPWAAWRDAGSPSPDPYTRAFVARSGALQLGNGEGIRFTATTDSTGQRLDRACRYLIEGRTPVATFWTMVPVALDDTPIARADGPASFVSNNIARLADGQMELYISKQLSPRNWLEITGDGPFAIVLTLYDITTVGGEELKLPVIVREGCA